MKKSLLLIGDHKTPKLEIVNKAKAYAEEKGFQYIGNLNISEKEAIMCPDNILKQIKEYDPDVILTYDVTLLVAELTIGEKSLLSLIESNGIACLDIDQDCATRVLVDKHKEQMLNDFKEFEQSYIPVVVIYHGNKNFENDRDFKMIQDYIKEELNEQKFSVLRFNHETVDMKDEIMEILTRATPQYIIQRKPFELPELQKWMKMIDEAIKGTRIKIIQMEEIEQAVQQDQININLYMN